MKRFNPRVLDEAREALNVTSDEKLAAELKVSGTTVRNWRHGRALPSVVHASELFKISGVPFGDMLIDSSSIQKAA